MEARGKTVYRPRPVYNGQIAHLLRGRVHYGALVLGGRETPSIHRMRA